MGNSQGGLNKMSCWLDLTVATVKTSPIKGQVPGTEGLRKKTQEFMQYPYLHNYVQSVFNTLKEVGIKVQGGTLVVSGDGRYWNDKAIQIIIKIAFANGVGRVWCGTNGLLSSPAASAVVRHREEGNVPFGAFICTAAPSPGGPDADFGIKFNGPDGGPAADKITDKVAAWTSKISEFLICDKLPDIGLNVPKVFVCGDKEVEVFDSVEDHLGVLARCFSFPQIKNMVTSPDFSMVFDCMNGAQGPYAKRIIEDILGAAPGSATNAEPLEDFGGGNADPNLTYATELIATMGLDSAGKKVACAKPPPCFGAATDGDGDRNMILSPQFFLSPSDSLAMIVANAELIPQFKDGLKACARSMPTSCAVDLVAKKKGIPCFEVPTGWKFFGTLMNSGNLKYFPGKPVYTPLICGEESFGTGASHLREKDGMWSILAWLQILAAKTEDNAGKIVTVEEVARDHWAEFGRHYYTRYDYEGVAQDKAEKMMNEMSLMNVKGKEVEHLNTKVSSSDMFEYTDPVDGSVTRNQGIRIMFEDGSRIIYRLSGTGVSGATVRIYLEKYIPPTGDLDMDPFEVTAPLAQVALKISKLVEITGREKPDVRT